MADAGRTRGSAIEAAPAVGQAAPGVASPGEIGARRRAFVLLRFTLIIAVGYLLLAQAGAQGLPTAVLIVLSLAFLSNLAALLVPPLWTELPRFTGGVVIADAAWITAALVLSGRFSADLFYLYFFVLFLAAIGENIRVVALGAVVVCGAYVAAVIGTTSLSDVIETSFLIRLPFLFAVAIFYGYLVDRIRRERRRAESQTAIVASLEQSRAALEASNRALQAEVRERQRAEASVRAANQRLQELGEMKSRFFTSVSHEIKTPLTAIKNALSLFSRRRSIDDEKQLLDIIRRNADRLNLMISDILDMTRIESGTQWIRAQAVELGVLVAAVVTAHEREAEAGGVRLESRVDPTAVIVRADRKFAQQIMSDLVSNALRATKSGGRVEIGTVVLDHLVEVSVEDTGIGLTAADQRLVFEPFYRVGDELVGRPPGAGLGLTLCRDLAHGHGSELEVQSTPGVGSRFFFHLPIDGPMATEILELEEGMRSTFCKHPYFSVLVIVQPFPTAGSGLELRERAEVLERLRTRLRADLPRSNDLLILQPAHGRVVLVLLTTTRDGARVVQSRLAAMLAAESFGLDDRPLPPPVVFGPSCFPEDGSFGAGLIDEALRAGGDRYEEAS